MATCFDVAKYILINTRGVGKVQLHTLVYYAQARAIVFDYKPLFRERIEAWSTGVMTPALYRIYCNDPIYYSDDGRSIIYSYLKADAIHERLGSDNNLTENQKSYIDFALSSYGDKSATALCKLICLEDPWKEARKGLSSRERAEITFASMAEYYTPIWWQ